MRNTNGLRLRTGRDREVPDILNMIDISKHFGTLKANDHINIDVHKG